jgi:hypothetical protein
MRWQQRPLAAVCEARSMICVAFLDARKRPGRRETPADGPGQRHPLVVGKMTRHLDLSPYLVSATSQPPAPGILRWGVAQKAAVIMSIQSGALSREEALARYMLSHEELAGWERAFAGKGVFGLQCKGSRVPTRPKLARGPADRAGPPVPP